MKEVVWSVHEESKQLDRAGLGISPKFWYVSHDDMTNTMMFEMNNNNFIKAVGGMWRQDGCIPMGGGGHFQRTQQTCIASGGVQGTAQVSGTGEAPHLR